jgi:tRNA uridine 5-carbamoylmethylation protein Kti12
MRKLFILVGNVASGKTSWIKKYLKFIEKENTPVVLSKDAIRTMMGAGEYLWDKSLEGVVHDCFIEMLRLFMFQKIDIICDETNMRKSTRFKLLSLAHTLGYNSFAVLMPHITMDETIRRRCQGEESAWGFSKEIWQEVYKRKDEAFVEPTIDEGFKEIWRPTFRVSARFENKSNNAKHEF